MTYADEYLASLAEPEKSCLARVRLAIRQIVPEATEEKSYGMPAFKYKGKYLIAYYAFKDHMSVFPGAGAIAAAKDELEGYVVAKGTVQFTPAKPLSPELLRRLVEGRLKEIILGGDV